MPALKRIGHKGADLIAPGNTLASFDAALAAGVDMVEFDVLPERPGSDRLVLAQPAQEPLRVELRREHVGPERGEVLIEARPRRGHQLEHRSVELHDLVLVRAQHEPGAAG